MQKVILLTLVLLTLTACAAEMPEEVKGVVEVQPIDEVVEDTPLERITCIDHDNDGFCTTLDCNDNNALVHPDAEEVCEDGIDNNCSGFDAECTVAQTTDNDHDGLTNAEEYALGTDIDNHDTDSDGLTDLEEVQTFGTDPLSYDTDGDGWADGGEATAHTDPLNIFETPIDEDNDFLYDLWEKNMFNSLSYYPHKDADEDELTNLQEFNMDTDPLDADSDNDKLWDGYEVHITRTDPNTADTDGDGYSDGREKTDRTDPLDPTSVPEVIIVLNRNADWQRPTHRVQAVSL